jgi:hypothetical protein
MGLTVAGAAARQGRLRDRQRRRGFAPTVLCPPTIPEAFVYGQNARGAPYGVSHDKHAGSVAATVYTADRGMTHYSGAPATACRALAVFVRWAGEQPAELPVSPSSGRETR